MKTIKFRGKDFHTGEWLYGDLRQRLGYFPSIIRHYPNDEGKVAYQVICVVEDTVGQFTGLYDKDGKEIYEGDILKLGGHGRNGVCEVKWNESVAAFCIRFSFEQMLGLKPLGDWLETERDIVIIGNIHDTPPRKTGSKKNHK